jgi:uncharacterized protein YndB with AHSA1/START domain
MTNGDTPGIPQLEIATTRIVNFPVELVFEAWSKPEHLKTWWGPAGFTNTFNEFNFVVGGRWDFIMHGPDKGNYHNECEFTRIEKPGHIEWERHSKPLFKVLAIFEPVNDDKTRIIFKQIFDTVEACEKIRRHTVGKNDENFDRLEMELSKMTSNS